MTDSPLDTEVKINLAGQDYILTFPIAAIWRFEDATGVMLISAEARTPEEIEATTQEFLGRNPRERMERVIDLLHAGLWARQRNLTREDVAVMIFPKDLERVEREVVSAFYAAMPRRAATDPTTPAPEAPAGDVAAIN